MTVDLRLGDCLEVMRGMHAASVDAVVTDPSWMYYQTGRYDATAWHEPIIAVDPKQYCGELFRLCGDPSAILLWCRWDVFGIHADALRDAGFAIKNCVVWDKGTHTAGDLDGNLGNRHEMAVFATKGRWVRHESRQQNLWCIPHLFSKTKRYHPTQKPVNLMTMSVETVSAPGDTILDPFMGSGTTGIACVRTGRNFIGCEINADYFAIAEKRIAQAQQQLRLAI